MFKRMQIQLTPEQHRQLKRRAMESGESTAAIVRRCVARYLDDGANAAQNDAEKKWELASKFVGKFRSTVSDLSERHDHYFTEDIASRKTSAGKKK